MLLLRTMLLLVLGNSASARGDSDSKVNMVHTLHCVARMAEGFWNRGDITRRGAGPQPALKAGFHYTGRDLATAQNRAGK